jgi:bifunctional UDP-N-acetylglucosamine pyrophosphorylase / glucosamine-1-phosphate N-acetyltransferase
MIDLVLDACQGAGVREITVVISPAQPDVAAHLAARDGDLEVVTQQEQRGTGHALAQVPEERLAAGDVLVLNGDAPLIRAGTIADLLRAHRASEAPATLASVLDPQRADGRILRASDGSLDRIVEYKDAGPELAAVSEINIGLYCFDGRRLVQALQGLKPDNRAGELYLTDVFAELRPAQVVRLNDREEGLGINDRVQLARAEQALRRRLLEDLMLSGVTVVDPASTFVDVGVKVGQDSVLEPFTVLRGATVVGEGCRIGPQADIRDSRVGDRARIEHSWLDSVEFGADSDCGPFSKLRPGTRIGEGVHVGSFVEMVRSSVGKGSKVPHVSYLGDTTVGENVNIGAGSITANFDKGVKNPTVIQDDAFIGVDSMLIAPVRIGQGARTGAGSVVTKDVPPGATVVGVPARVVRRKETE